MKVVVLNDDGVNDPGLWALARLGDVRVYALDRDYSGAGMSITLREKFHMVERCLPDAAGTDIPALTVGGAPATIAALACLHAFDTDPDVLVSGINTGWNAGFQAYVVSGTVGAARVAVDRGITGVAVSAPGPFDSPRGGVNYQAIACATGRVVKAIAETGELGTPVLVNINSPASVDASTSAWLTTPARFATYGDTRLVDGRPPVDAHQTVRIGYGDNRSKPVQSGDEADALWSGAASICVTDPRTSRVVHDDPWPLIAEAFATAV